MHQAVHTSLFVVIWNGGGGGERAHALRGKQVGLEATAVLCALVCLDHWMMDAAVHASLFCALEMLGGGGGGWAHTLRRKQAGLEAVLQGLYWCWKAHASR
jgi:hypothetical protein